MTSIPIPELFMYARSVKSSTTTLVGASLASCHAVLSTCSQAAVTSPRTAITATAGDWRLTDISMLTLTMAYPCPDDGPVETSAGSTSWMKSTRRVMVKMCL